MSVLSSTKSQNPLANAQQQKRPWSGTNLLATFQVSVVCRMLLHENNERPKAARFTCVRLFMAESRRRLGSQAILWGAELANPIKLTCSNTDPAVSTQSIASSWICRNRRKPVWRVRALDSQRVWRMHARCARTWSGRRRKSRKLILGNKPKKEKKKNDFAYRSIASSFSEGVSSLI